MWKTAKTLWAALGAWWAVVLAGPQAFPGVTESQLEALVERACRRVLQAHEARFAAGAAASLGRETTPVQVCFMDRNERTIRGEQAIPAYLRKPILTHDGRTYAASRYEAGTWIYRESA